MEGFQEQQQKQQDTNAVSVKRAGGGGGWKQPHRYKPTSRSENHKQLLL